MASHPLVNKLNEDGVAEIFEMGRDDARAFVDGGIEMGDLNDFVEAMDTAQGKADDEGKEAYVVIRIKGSKLS